jgi:hypothetical protein
MALKDDGVLNTERSKIVNNDFKIPVIGEYVRNIGTLVKIETIQPPTPAPYKEYIFEEIEARCELRRYDEQLDKIEELNDFYGKETSIKTAIKDMIEYCKIHRITKDSEVEVIVVKVARQYRATPTGKVEFWDKKFADFKPLDNYQSERDLPEPIETIVWSSKKDGV